MGRSHSDDGAVEGDVRRDEQPLPRPAIVNAVELEASVGMEAKMPPQLKEVYPGRA